MKLLERKVVGNYLVAIFPDPESENPREFCDYADHMISWHRRSRLGDKHEFSDAEDLFYWLSGYELDAVRSESEDRQINRLPKGRGWEDLSTDEGIDILQKSKGYAEAVLEWFRKRRSDEILRNHVILPIYAYEHGGITISTGGFSCPWDSGQVGFVYISREEAALAYNLPKDSSWSTMVRPVPLADACTLHQWATDYCEDSVKTYDQWLQGDVYGYRIFEYGPEKQAIVAAYQGVDVEDIDIDDIDLDRLNETDSCWGFYGQEYCMQEALDYVPEEEETQPINAPSPF